MSKINLMFHDVKLNPSRWNTRPSQFENLMNQIVMHANRDNIDITVDDAGKGNHEYMLPIFEKNNLKATIFVPTKFISKGSNTSTYMTASQIKEFSDLGHTIGSHSHSHPKNISLLSRNAIQSEWKKSKDILESITGKEVNTCSIPGGFFTFKQLEIIKELGYLIVYNSVPTYKLHKFDGVNLWGRFSIERGITKSQFERILSKDILKQKGLYYRQKASQLFHTLRHRMT